LYIPLLLFSQTDTASRGIQWTEGLSWEQVKQKAKAENKYIFVDAFTTWCGPCKKMDKEVYSDIAVGEYFNLRFISIKVQMDTTNGDSEEIKKWYADAYKIRNVFKVSSFPSYLFFSPEGVIIHRDVGLQSKNDLVSIAETSFTPANQYYAMIDRYEKGERDKKLLMKLIMATKRLDDEDGAARVFKDFLQNFSEIELYKQEYIDFIKSIQGLPGSEAIVRNYISNFLVNLNDEDLFKKSNLELVQSNPYYFDSESRIFRSFYKQKEKIDKILGNGAADWFVKVIINKEEISDKLWKNGKPIKMIPDWKSFQTSISKKYNSKIAENLISRAQLSYYDNVQNWSMYFQSVEEIMKKYPPESRGKNFSHAIGGIAEYGDDSWALNVVAWNVFLECSDRRLLRKALIWSDRSIVLGTGNTIVQYLDTKANLLYKLGRVSEAIKCEERAIDVDDKWAKENGYNKGGFVEKYNAVIEKMKKGIPTWSVPASDEKKN